MKLGILASGELGAKTLIQLLNESQILFVMTDKNSEKIINICEKNDIKYFTGNPRNGRCTDFIKSVQIEVLISINYLFLIEEDLITLPSKLAFNIHGSLLPKYRGRTPHVWAIINNEKTTGITAHVIDKGCDTGTIIEQIVIEVDDDDTGADVLNKFGTLYFPLIKKVLSNLEKSNIVLKEQEHNKATFFGKRTPRDGLINWAWQKERIRNWVRAQSYPYPGAFTFHNSNRIIIDRITFSDYSFSNDMFDGLIISINPLLIKTPNGVVEIVSQRVTDVTLKIGDILK